MSFTQVPDTENLSADLSRSQEDEEFQTFYPEIQSLVTIIVPVCFGIIALIGFFGNILVILVVLFNKKMHSTTNLLIVNLAIADLLFVVLCIPFTGADYVMENWPFGDIWCRIVHYLIVVTALASIYTLVLMSVDRFLAVVHPIRSRILRSKNIIQISCVIILWIVILTITAPVIMLHGTVNYKPLGVTMVTCCFKDSNSFLSVADYQITFFAGSYLLPLMMISGLYLRMITRLWRQGGDIRMSIESQRGRKRVTRLVVILVITFALLWLPIQLILLLKALNLYHATTKLKVVLQIVAQLLAYTSSCINPVLYAFLSDNFRKAFHKII
uniref:G-protein coupled receptors family 1 profile domain-containing protein n=1 Tax=Glossina brevipalpis TaxID=37001 RepID=A0A1A9WYP0_9MUSC